MKRKRQKIEKNVKIIELFDIKKLHQHIFSLILKREKFLEHQFLDEITAWTNADYINDLLTIIAQCSEFEQKKLFHKSSNINISVQDIFLNYFMTNFDKNINKKNFKINFIENIKKRLNKRNTPTIELCKNIVNSYNILIGYYNFHYRHCVERKINNNDVEVHGLSIETCEATIETTRKSNSYHTCNKFYYNYKKMSYCDNCSIFNKKLEIVLLYEGQIEKKRKIEGNSNSK